MLLQLIKYRCYLISRSCPIHCRALAPERAGSHSSGARATCWELKNQTCTVRSHRGMWVKASNPEKGVDSSLEQCWTKPDSLVFAPQDEFRNSAPSAAVRAPILPQNHSQPILELLLSESSTSLPVFRGSTLVRQSTPAPEDIPIPHGGGSPAIKQKGKRISPVMDFISREMRCNMNPTLNVQVRILLDT